MLYNGVLRAMACEDGRIRFGFPPDMIGQSVHGKFTTTLHAINSGVIKLSRLQPACKIYRGMTGMKLPKVFHHSDAHNISGRARKSTLHFSFVSA